MKKILILLSGGIDSTTLLWSSLARVDSVYCLNMYYGQKHAIEIEMARWQVNKAREVYPSKSIEYKELDISSIFINKDSSALLQGSNKEIAHESYADQLKHTDVVSAYVPYRNGLFLSVATSIAYQFDCDTIIYGAHADDAVKRENGSAAYPDCTIDFIEAQALAIKEGTAGKVQLQAPLWKSNKSEVVGYGISNIPHQLVREIFEHTHSCYEGVEGGCGTCGTCRDARAALDAWELTRGLKQH